MSDTGTLLHSLPRLRTSETLVARSGVVDREMRSII